MQNYLLSREMFERSLESDPGSWWVWVVVVVVEEEISVGALGVS